MAKTSDSWRAEGGLAAGASGTTLTYIEKGSVTVDLASMLTDTVADKDITITGAVAGDVVILNPPTDAMTAGMVVGQAHVSADNTVTVRVFNQSGGTIDETSATWYYTLIRS